jgi:hypothetical protein
MEPAVLNEGVVFLQARKEANNKKRNTLFMEQLLIRYEDKEIAAGFKRKTEEERDKAPFRGSPKGKHQELNHKHQIKSEE